MARRKITYIIEDYEYSIHDFSMAFTCLFFSIYCFALFFVGTAVHFPIILDRFWLEISGIFLGIVIAFTVILFYFYFIYVWLFIFFLTFFINIILYLDTFLDFYLLFFTTVPFYHPYQAIFLWVGHFLFAYAFIYIFILLFLAQLTLIIRHPILMFYFMYIILFTWMYWPFTFTYVGGMELNGWEYDPGWVKYDPSRHYPGVDRHYHGIENVSGLQLANAEYDPYKPPRMTQRSRHKPNRGVPYIESTDSIDFYN